MNAPLPDPASALLANLPGLLPKLEALYKMSMPARIAGRWRAAAIVTFTAKDTPETKSA
jgi:hypothetical protein